MTILITVFGCIFTSGIAQLRSNPFSDKMEMKNLVKSIHGDSCTIMITDGGMSAMVLDEKLNYRYSIKGGVEEDGFYSASDAVYRNGYIYIADSFDMPRIARFTENGEFDCYVYQSENIITSLESDADGIVITEVSDGIINGIIIDDGGNVLTEKSFHTDYNASEIADCDIYFNVRNDTAYAAAALRNGNVYTFDENGSRLAYNAAAVESDEYYSLVLEVDYDENGVLYANDMGKRVVYRIDNDIEEVIKKGESMDMQTGSLAEYPIYNGLNAYGNGKISVVSTEYVYDENEDNYIYIYDDYTKDTAENKVIFNGNTVDKNTVNIIKGYAAAVAAVLFAVCLMYSVVKFAIAFKTVKIEVSTKVQFGVLLAVVVATIFTTGQLVSSYNKRYSDEVMNKITSTSLMMSQDLSKCDIESIDSPDDCYGEQWNEIDRTIHEYSDNTEDSEEVYFVIYKEIDGIISEIYSAEDHNVGFYPMSGMFEGSIEQEIYETGKPYQSNSYSSADGSYMMVVYPVMNESGKVIALLETGTDLYVFNTDNSELVKNVLVYVLMSLSIALLILSEVLISKEGFSDRRHAIKEKRLVSPVLIRPLVFVVYFVANMSTVFTPLYGTMLWKESDPFSAEIASALPISVETVSAALAAVFAGFICDKISCKNLSFAAAFFYLTGNLMACFARNLYVFIGANVCTGIAGGSFAIAINAYIAAFSDEKYRSKGFAGLNAACLAGINCGTVVGSMVAEHFGFRRTYFAAACVIPVVVVLAALCMQGRKYLSLFTSYDEAEQDSDKNNISVFRFVLSPRVWTFFLMIIFPYIICASFLSYFFPIYGSDSHLTETQISLAFLLSGVVSIYLGPVLSEAISKKLGTYRSMVLASVIYASALVFFVVSPSVLSCFIVVAMFAIADSFGMTAQSVYFTNLPEVKKLGSGKAMGINTTVENISSACGPMIFAYIFILGTKKGIMLLAVAFAVMLVVFTMANRLAGKKERVKK